MMKASPESPRMFESDLVDFFSRTHPAVVPILFVPTTSGLLWYSVARMGVGPMTTAGLFVAGALWWSFMEYWLHRTFFHWIPEGRWGERMHFLVHGVHHDWPRDKYRLVMPPAVSITLFFIFLAMNLGALGLTYGWAFHAGVTFGYMGYDMVHYYVHHYNPKSKYFLNLKKHHMLHHFKDPEKRYGVSSKLWDFVFRTQA
jgi:sterol desaturase/sphingolipid hydroxylase (fatty acid hydroxylase superfamily)